VATPPRVVLDTNLVLSALVFSHGRLGPLRRAWQAGLCIPLVSAVTAADLLRVLQYPKFKLTPSEREDFLSDYLPYCRAVAIPARLPRMAQSRDPFDQPFLELATVGRADFLVSGDRDLPAMAPNFKRPIVNAAAFLERLASN